MKRKTVLVIYNEEELQKVNDQLAFMQEQPILNSGKFPRYFKVTENEFEEIAAAEDPLEDKHVFAGIPA